MAGKDFGGVMYLRDSNGANLSIRGNFSVMPGNLSSEVVVNQDASVDRTFTPEAPSAEVTIADKNVDVQALIGLPRRNITITEQTTEVQHLFTSAFFTGRPTTNRLNGEVSGLTIAAEAYRRIPG